MGTNDPGTNENMSMGLRMRWMNDWILLRCVLNKYRQKNDVPQMNGIATSYTFTSGERMY